MKKTRWTAVCFLAAAVAAGGGGCRVRPAVFPGSGVQTGVASWYGGEFQGRLTSSREVFDMNDLTAAHNTLPLGSQVAVTNLENGLSVIVRINDRGPFAKNRVIDLSYAAAKAIGLIGPGTARVRIELLGQVQVGVRDAGFSVQAGAFISQANAAALKTRLESLGFSGVFIGRLATPRQTFYRVRIEAGSREEARDTALRLLEVGGTPIVCEGQ